MSLDENTNDITTCGESANGCSHPCAPVAPATPAADPAPPPSNSPTKGSQRKRGGAGQAVGLAVGRGAPNQGTITKRIEQFGRALRKVIEQHNGGPATLTQEAMITTARTHERRAAYCERWLKTEEKDAAEKATDRKMELLATISAARESRDRTLEKLFGTSDGRGSNAHDPFTAAIRAAETAETPAVAFPLAPESLPTTSDDPTIDPSPADAS